MERNKKDIKNELAYFCRVIKNIYIKDSVKRSKIKEHEISIDEILYDSLFAEFDVDK